MVVSFLALVSLLELDSKGMSPFFVFWVLMASSLHLDRFKPGPATVIWFAFFALEALIFGGLVIRRGLRAPAQGIAT